MRLRDLPGLGPMSEKMLIEVGIESREELERVGPVRAFLMLKRRGQKPSLNLLYAMTGALSETHWQQIARSQRFALLQELDGFADLERMLKDEGVTLDLYPHPALDK